MNLEYIVTPVVISALIAAAISLLAAIINNRTIRKTNSDKLQADLKAFNVRIETDLNISLQKIFCLIIKLQLQTDQDFKKGKF